MFFEMRFELGTLDLGERSLPFGLLVINNTHPLFVYCIICRKHNVVRVDRKFILLRTVLASAFYAQ